MIETKNKKKIHEYAQSVRDLLDKIEAQVVERDSTPQAKFKVGGWVRNHDSGTAYQVCGVSENPDEQTVVRALPGDGIFTVLTKDITPWLPAVGEEFYAESKNQGKGRFTCQAIATVRYVNEPAIFIRGTVDNGEFVLLSECRPLAFVPQSELERVQALLAEKYPRFTVEGTEKRLPKMDEWYLTSYSAPVRASANHVQGEEGADPFWILHYELVWQEDFKGWFVIHRDETFTIIGQEPRPIGSDDWFMWSGELKDGKPVEVKA